LEATRGFASKLLGEEEDEESPHDNAADAGGRRGIAQEWFGLPLWMAPA